MSESDSTRWDEYYQRMAAAFPVPARVLAEHDYLLPQQGRSLEVACGRGGNALFLAVNGLESHAWDISAEALESVSGHAAQLQVRVETRQCDLTRVHPGPGEYDIIVVSHYLDRGLIPALKTALKQDGLIFYQTFTRLKVCDRGPRNPDYLLERNELLQLFSDLELVFYHEPDAIGSIHRGLRDEAMLIARRM